MKLKSLALSLALAALPMSAMADTPAAEQFDAGIAAGVTAFDLDYDGAIRRIEIVEKLDAELDAPDDSTGAIYLAQVDGRPATIVRIENDLDIAFDDTPPEEGTGGRRRRSVDTWAGDYSWGNDLLETADELPGRGNPSDESKALHVWIFLHDTAGEGSHAKFMNWYVSWWVREMTTNVAPGVPLRVTLRSHVKGLSDMNYDAGEAKDRIVDVGRRGRAYAAEHGAKDGDINMSILFVDRPPANWPEGRAGFAGFYLRAAIASRLGPRSVVAHETGHLLSALHKDYESRFWCSTIMEEVSAAKIGCRVYSDANAERIRQFLNVHL